MARPFAEHERLLLTDIFFGFDDEERGLLSLRRQSLASLLDIVHAYSEASVPLEVTEEAALDDMLLLGPAYYGALVGADGKQACSYDPPEYANCAVCGECPEFCVTG